jgi:hypothetical protein
MGGTAASRPAQALLAEGAGPSVAAEEAAEAEAAEETPELGLSAEEKEKVGCTIPPCQRRLPCSYGWYATCPQQAAIKIQAAGRGMLDRKAVAAKKAAKAAGEGGPAAEGEAAEAEAEAAEEAEEAAEGGRLSRAVHAAPSDSYSPPTLHVCRPS